MKKRKVEFDERGLRIDGVFHPLVSGQFEFWRHHPLYWRKILQAMKDSGLEFVSTFVCWDFHEVARGDFDFTGRTYPSRDLAGFLDLCAEEGFQVLMRIGPYIDAEWPTRGPAPDVADLERIHPWYQERTREYVEALAPILIPRLAPAGGPVVLTVLDCEVYFPRSTSVASSSTSGYVQVPYDSDLVMSKYREWLRRRYDRPEVAAEAWSKPGLTFEEVAEPDYLRAGLVEILDSFEFITDTLREVTEGLKAMCVKAGIVGVPFSTSSKTVMHYIDWRVVESDLDSFAQVIFLPYLWSGDVKLVASWYLRLCRARFKFPWTVEFIGGSPDGLAEIFGLGLIRPEHHRFTPLLSAALGLRGLSWYMFVERDSFIFCPISPIGQIRPNMAGFRDAITVLKRLCPDRHFATVGLLWSKNHHRCHVATQIQTWHNIPGEIGRRYDQSRELGPWWDVFRRLHEKDVDFDVVPLDQELDGYKVLIYAGPDFAQRAEMERLQVWLDKGGTLIVTTALPSRSIDGSELTDIAAAIRSAPTVIARPWGRLEETLEQVGAQHAIRAEATDLWTFAYRDNEGWTLFIANVGSIAVSAGVHLGPMVMDDARGRTAIDLLDGREWKVAHEELWDEVPVLAPNTVCCVRITV